MGAGGGGHVSLCAYVSLANGIPVALCMYWCSFYLALCLPVPSAVRWVRGAWDLRVQEGVAHRGRSAEWERETELTSKYK